MKSFLLLASPAVATIVIAAAGCSNGGSPGLDLNFPAADLPTCPTGYSRWWLLPAPATCGGCEAGSAYLLCRSGAWVACSCTNPAGEGTGVFCEDYDAGVVAETSAPDGRTDGETGPSGDTGDTDHAGDAD